MISDAFSIQILARIASQSVGDGSCEFKAQRWNTNGFSDTEIYQLTVNERSFALRSWPRIDSSHAKVKFWQDCNRAFEVVPEPILDNKTPFPKLHFWKTASNHDGVILEHDRSLWTISDWVEGRPTRPADLQSKLVEHLARVLATIHLYSMEISERARAPTRDQMHSRTLHERQQFLEGFGARDLERAHRHTFFHANPLREPVLDSLANTLRLQNEWKRFLESSSNRLRPCHWIVRDLWYQNVLLTEDARFASIVDLGAARYDWPGLDFVRLFGSIINILKAKFMLSTEAIWRSAFAAYSSVHPNHSITSLSECTLMHEIANRLSIVQWVRWIDEGRFSTADHASSQRIGHRLSELLNG